jgi:hypothetical protein
MHRPFAIVHVATGRPFDNYTISLLVHILAHVADMLT